MGNRNCSLTGGQNCSSKLGSSTTAEQATQGVDIKGKVYVVTGANTGLSQIKQNTIVEDWSLLTIKVLEQKQHVFYRFVVEQLY